MKISLTARLIAIMVLSVFLSSLVSILFVSSVTVSKIRGINSQRDENIAVLVADSLSAAGEKGSLQLSRAISSQGMMKNRHSRSDGRMGHSMPPPRKSAESSQGRLLPGQPLVMTELGAFVPILITDEKGKILQGRYRSSHEDEEDLPEAGEDYLRDDLYRQGVPYYLNGRIAGYVLAGNQAGQEESLEDLYQVTSVVKGILLYPIISALLASLFGIVLLKRALRPLKSLYLGVQTLQKGEYSYRVELPESRWSIRDDLTRLSEGFNEMAAGLEASEEWKKQIISDTAHELRTPVSLIMGNLEMILDGVYKADRSRLESLYRESAALADLIKNLQLLASEESGKRGTERVIISLSDLIHRTSEDFRALALQNDITLHAAAGDGITMAAERNKLRQVLKNLMVNALKFTPRGGDVYLSCRRQNGEIRLEIEDSGEGIPPEFREKIFHRFFKIDSSRNSSGNGLGLSISRAIIENQGGQLTVHDGTSGGALFRISFPDKDLG